MKRNDLDFNNSCVIDYFYNQYRNYYDIRYFRIFHILMVCSNCTYAYDKCNMVCGGGVKTMVTRDEIIKAQELEKKTLKAQAIADTREYLEGDFTNLLNRIFIKDGEDTAILAIARWKKYNEIFFTLGGRMSSPLYDLEYFLQELQNNGFEVAEDKCYTCPGLDNIIIKV